MRKLATIGTLIAMLAALAACGGTKHTTTKLPPKPCRITSTKSACEAHILRSLIKDIAPGQVYTVPARVQFRPNPMRCPNRRYPALCKKH